MRCEYEEWQDELKGRRHRSSGWLVALAVLLLIGAGIAQQIAEERAHPASLYVTPGAR